MAPAASKPFRLLGLPGELRNRIYRLAIVSDDAIRVTTQGYERSALVSANRQLRAETIKIFYCENTFSITIHDYNTDVAHRFLQRSMGLLVSLAELFPEDAVIDPEISVGLSGGPHWENWVRWMERRHGDEHFCEMITPEVCAAVGVVSPTVYALGAMAIQVDSMRDLPWERVKSLLQKQRPVLVNIDPDWAIDH